MTTSAENRAQAFRMPRVLARGPGRRPGEVRRELRRELYRGLRAGLLALGALALTGCQTLSGLNPFGSSGPPAGQPGFVRGFLGGIATEDPAAALIGRQVLSAGGTAVDAAVAAGFAMSVTLPSRVGIGGGGACLVFDPAKAATEAVLFLPGARERTPAGADRPAAVPLLARGLFALHTRKPGRPFEELMAPAEQLARFGTEVSRGLAADLAAVAGPLLADPGAQAVFGRPGGGAKQAGEQLLQPELAGTLGQLRLAGVGDLHQGTLARRLEEVSRSAGGSLTLEELRAALPTLGRPLDLAVRGGDRIAFLPPPADGGLAAAAAFEALRNGADIPTGSARGLAAVAAWRARGGDPAGYVTAANLPPAGPGALPASAGLITFDREGVAVSCAFTLNNLFGTGRIAPGLGFLLAAAPGIGAVQPALLSAAIAYNPNIRGFRLAAAASGQQAAPIGVAGPAALQLLRALPPETALEGGAPGPARTQLAACLNYLPGRADRCIAVSDPRGAGVALGAVDQ
ncbi:gamma-glutamyltransferase [Paracraurococcus lichenis]|uniref:Gamma-glutamyltransferase n=1 Tax=Paracraurococcus lichenis TaxID=3064888 RepID=A0ABT9DZ06_9PROT|nr:gamma-glutamyltransferase [Paracraurococcus sp. LOR1-02]MDO9709145.1 gamma-glutamyltransferase [Paracraurococcus sp. LOR1-02]